MAGLARKIKQKVQGVDRKKTVGKKFGIDTQEMVKKFVQKQKGFLNKGDFVLFWSAMDEDAHELNVYLHTLLQYLLQYLQNDKNAPLPPQVLLNTVNFLTLRVTLPHTKQVTEIISKWNKHKGKYDSRLLPSAQDVLGILHKRVIEKSEAFDSLIIQCHQFYSHDELARIADYCANPTIVHILNGRDRVGSASGDKTFMWAYVKHLSATNPDAFRDMLNSVIVKLRSITGTIYLLPKLAELSLLALIFMISQIISYNRVPEESFIERAMVVLKRFYLWPVPYGTQARDLLLKLKKERVAPGLGVLHRIWQESHLPQIVTEYHDQDFAVHEFRPLYYLFDSKDKNALLFSNVMVIKDESEWGENYEVHTGVSARMCGLIILNIFHFEIKVSEKLLESVKALNETAVVTFYKQVIDVFLMSSKSGDPTVAREARRDALTELASQIIEHASEMDEDDHLDLHDIPKNYRLPLPHMQHTGIVCDLHHETYPKRGAIAAGEATFPINQVFLKISNVLKRLSKISSQKDPITLRFIVAGGNPILNAAATAYATLYRFYEQLLKQFNLEFLVIPYSRNHYAEWLAREDPWYNRHIYLPVQTDLFIAPALQFKSTRVKQSAGKLTCVGKFFRDMAESYSREAEHTARLMLWECHAWSDESSGTSTNTPDRVLPFCQRVELGQEAEFEGFKATFSSGEEDESSDEADEEEKKVDTPIIANEEMKDEEYAFEYNPTTLDIEWENVDMIGNPANTLSQKGQQFQSLVIATCPRHGDAGTPPSPTEEGVAQMYATVKVTAKKKKQQQEYRLLKDEPWQHIRSVTLQVKDLEERFWIKVDDRLYGPFQKVRVVPMVNPIEQRQVYMPIRTFFPVDSLYQ